MEVGVAEENLVWIVPAGIRRVDPLLGEVVLSDVVRLGFLSGQGPGIHQKTEDGQREERTNDGSALLQQIHDFSS